MSREKKERVEQRYNAVLLVLVLYICQVALLHCLTAILDTTEDDIDDIENNPSSRDQQRTSLLS